MSPFPLIAAAVAALLATAILTPLAARLAILLDVIDRPSERKISDRKGIPLLGGLAVVGGSLLGFFAFGLAAQASDFTIVRSQLATFMAGGMVLVLVGAWDDRFELGAWQKIPFQLLASLIAINGGFVIDYFTNPITLITSPLPVWLSWLITLGWIVVVTNAMNLIDGLDGLTAGTGAIIAGTLGVICYQADQIGGLLIAVVTMGALLGFLPFNFPPARIFLGDAGALFIGFALAIVSVQGYRKAALLTFIVPLLALAIPLLDTVLSVIRRLRAGKGIFSADKMHMHHLLLAREGSHRRAVLWLYFQTLCFSVIAVSFSDLQGYSAYFFLGAVILLTLRMVKNLGVMQLEETPSARDGTPEPNTSPPEEPSR
ncbi:MAG: undecaprenyl/decaprenyl-phosphate alpha-N-acetylglucosaminyl 1-phosphate transferase [Myxococcota bacterium]|nr:undecaprenyl/decaprenyl-phosphate alpha-N-acetylglucosaminyl 1-phosphate transferase [Myxococcota bacterium]